MELVEFHWVETKLYVDDRFQQEALAALVGENLHRYAVEVVKVFATELLYVEFGVWLYLARRSQLPVVSLRGEIGELHIVVAVVNDVCLEACGCHLLWRHRHIGNICRELVTALAFLHWSLESDRAVGGIVVLVVLCHVDGFLLLVGNKS